MLFRPNSIALLYNNFGLFKWRDVIYRFVLGTIFCGFGNSAGREGPTVHLSSAAASAMAQNMGFSKQQVQSSVPAGMGAGIAASFNAPLSAISFVFEELLGGFGAARKNGGIIIAVIIAAAVARLTLGENPVLPVGFTDFHTSWWMFVCLPIALASGFTGEAFLALLLKLRGFVREKSRLPVWALAGLGGLVVGCLAITAYYATGYNSVFSVGYGILIPAFGGKVCFWTLLMICVFKFFATIINYAMGGSGGLFSPALVIGGTLGGAIGAAACAIFDLDQSVIGACVLLGMGSCFASIIRCPITSILMIFELTLNYSLILPLIAGNLISYSIARSLNKTGLYDALLLQDGITLRKMPAPKGGRDWANLPVSAIMTFNPSCISGSDTPAEALEKLEAKSLEYRSYPVVGADGEYLGIIGEKFLIEMKAEQKPCSELVWRKPEDNTIFTDTSISSAAAFFVESDSEDVAVVQRVQPTKVVGILTLHDIARYSSNV